MAKTPTCTWHRTVSLVVALLVAHSAPTAAPWEPNETQASAEKELIDYEFSQTRGQFTWVDALGRLWLGNVNPNTGLFDPIDGRGTLVDPDAITVADAFLTFNGPEWAKSARGDQIAYTKFVAGKPHNSRTARIAVAKQAKDGSWTYAFLSPNAPRFAPYASENDDDLAPIITYVDNVGNHYWRETGRANTEQLIAVAEPSSIPIRSVRGARSLLPSIAVAGVKQVHTYDVDTKALQQLTFDDGNKAGSWMWRAPEFGNEFVLTTVVNATVRVYRQLAADGALKWMPVHVLQPPEGWEIYSPEPFVYEGRSRMFMALGVIVDKFPSQIWIANIDPANPAFKRISPEAPLRVRADPEVFITKERGPLIYFNRFVLSDGPKPGKCFSIECSEGAWFVDPGWAAAP